MTPAHSKREPPPTQNKIESLNAIVNALHTTFYCVNKGGGEEFHIKDDELDSQLFCFFFSISYVAHKKK